jgi:hypothetical protein
MPVVEETNGTLTLGTAAERNFPLIGSGHAATQYDIAPDGRIYFLDQSVAPQVTEIRIVLGWQQLLLQTP